MHTASSHSAALQALQLPFSTGVLAWPMQGALFLHAQPGWPWGGFVAEQPSKPAADALLREGHAIQVVEEAPVAATGSAPLVLVLPPRQRDALRTLLARAVDACAEGGAVLVSVDNDAGAKSVEADLRTLMGGLDCTLSKHHCRVFWARKDSARCDAKLLQEWHQRDAPRRIDAPQLAQRGFLSRPGVFAWDRIDPASALLAEHLPIYLRGEGADLGAGWGYLSLQVLARNPQVQALDLYEADARALALSRHNLGEAAPAARIGFHWHDVTAGLPRAYDFIVTNPPFHLHDRADRPELGQRFIAVAAQALQRRGRLYLVANRHLPYEAALSAGFAQVRVLAQRDGFKVVEAVRA
jgi:16S rRNA (guanine1207-N2)-methyltransferase